MPRGRDPAEILDVDDAGVAVECRGQTSKAAQYCVRREVGAQDVGEVVWNSALGSSDTLAGMPAVALGKTQGDGRLSVLRNRDPLEVGTAPRREQQDVHGASGSSSPPPATVPFPESPSSSSGRPPVPFRRFDSLP